MEKIRQQIMLEADVYDWVSDVRVAEHHKNTSQTLNSMLRNYKILTGTLLKAQKDNTTKEQEVVKLETKIENWREKYKLATPITKE